MRTIKPPFFELGPKAYLYGAEMLELAKYADLLSEEYDIDIILTPQTVDIRMLVEACRNVHVFAQHVDENPIGHGVGTNLAEALKEAGAEGALLNHAEKRLGLCQLERCISRAREVGLLTLVCADSPLQAAAIAHFGPDMMIVESPELIGTGRRCEGDADAIRRTNALVASVNPDILILHAAGISDAGDVCRIMAAGSDATGSTSGVLLAEDPRRMLRNMIQAVRAAWNERSDHSEEER
jgi:triosephosphate isomerase